MWILLIEDEARLRSSLKQGLEEEGYVVDQAADGEAGLDEARAHGYDVLVVDWRLPRRDGRSVVEALREAGRAVPTSADGEPCMEMKRQTGCRGSLQEAEPS
jgi:two-component system OmpR family response regulator